MGLCMPIWATAAVGLLNYEPMRICYDRLVLTAGMMVPGQGSEAEEGTSTLRYLPTLYARRCPVLT